MVSTPARRPHGFTLIELIVVMAIIASLVTLAMPRYFHSVERSREAVLRQDLRVMRDAIDKFFADLGRYPATLEELADKRYLRAVPPDPITESSSTWVVVPPPDAPDALSGVYDVRSGAPGKSLEGEAYAAW
ncbi:MAG TPA: prepilin-type N-terminal cleavage/methylation domain-containing protein [Caldimonas sp.]|nr:prepilin-type N-terminal cleavage/methylation domain-containing protein [Caldimonas sp.]